MEAEETEFNEVEDFVFKEKENVRIGTGFGSVESAIGNLILVSNKYGFVIAAIKKGLRFIRSQNLHKKSSDHDSTVQISLEDNATSIGLAADHLTLSVVITNSTKVLLYDIPKISGRDVATFASPDFNSEVEDLRWHATDPNTFAVKLADGRVIEYNVSTGAQISVATLRDVMSISWHPSQNTLACLLEDGKIEIYTKNGNSYNASRSLPALEAEGNDSADASYIRWFDDNLIGVGYSLSETDVAFLMITLKGDDYEAQKMLSPTDTENPSFSTAYIKEWKALLWVTTGAQDIEVMSLGDDGKWFTAVLMDDARPNVPMDNFILGMGFDYTNTVQLKKGEDTFYPVSPLLVFVTHEGRLCTFDFINKADKDVAPFMVSNVPALPAPKQRGSVTSNVNSGAPIGSPNIATTPANNNAAAQTPTPAAPKTGSTSFGFGDTVSSLSFTSGTSSNSFGFGGSTPNTSATTNPTTPAFGASTPAGSTTPGTSTTTSNPGTFNFGFGTPTQFDKPAATPAAPKTSLSSSGSNTFSFGGPTTDAGKKDEKKDANPFGFGSGTASFGFGDTAPKPTENKPPAADAPKLGTSGSAFSFGLSNPEPSAVGSPSVQRRAQAAPPKQAPATDFGFGAGGTSFTFDAKPKAPSATTAPTTAAPPKTSSQQPISFAPAPKQATQQGTTQAQPGPIKINLNTPGSQAPPTNQGTASIQNVPGATKAPQSAQPPQPQPVQGQQAARPKQGVTAQELISRPINPERGIEQQFMEQIAIFTEAMRRAHSWVADTVNKIKAIQQGIKMPPERPQLPFTEAQLTQLCSSTSDVTVKIDQDNVEIEALKRQVDALKINFLDAFAFAQEAESLIMASQDESYQHLLDSRNLDPEAQETRKKLKRLINEVDSSVKQVEQYLDSMMIKRGKRDDKNFKVPTLASLYGTLRSHYEIVANQKQKIKQLSDAFDRIQLRLAAEGRPVPSAAWDDLKKVQSAQKVKKISRTLQSKPQFSYNPTSVMAAPTENVDFDPEMPYYYYNKHPSGSRMRELKQILKQRFVSTGRSKPNKNVVNIPEDLLELKLTPSTPVQSYRQPSSLTSTPQTQVSNVTPKMTPTAGVSPMSTNLLNQPKPAMMSSPFAAAPAPSAAPSAVTQWSAAPPKAAAAPMQFGFPAAAPTKQPAPASRVIDDDEGSIDEELSTAEMLKKMQHKPSAPNAGNNQASNDNKDFLAGQKFGVPNLTNSSLIKPTPSPAKSLSASGTQFTTGRVRFGVAEDQDGEEEEEYEEDEEYDEEYDDEDGTPDEEYDEPEQPKPSPVKPRPQVPVAAAKTSGNSLNGSGSFGFGTTGSSFSFGQPSAGSNTNKPAQSATTAPFTLNTSGSTSTSASAFNFNAGSTKGPAPAQQAAMTGPKPGEKRKTGAPSTLVSYHDPEEEDEEEEEGEDSEDSYVESTGPRPGVAPSSGAVKVSPKPAEQSKPLGTSGSFSFGAADSTKPGTSSFGFGAPSTAATDANKPIATAAPSTGSSSLGFGSLSSLGANTFSFGGPTGGDKKPGDTKPATGTSSTFSFGSLGATDATKPATGTSTSDPKSSPGTKPTTSTDKPAGTTLGSSLTFGGPSTTTAGDKPPTSGSSTFTFGATTSSSSPKADTKPATTTTPATGSTFGFGTTPSTDANKPTTATTPATSSTPATNTTTAGTTTTTTAPSTATTGTGFGFGSSGTSSTFGFGSSGTSSTFGFGSTPAATTPGTTSTAAPFGTPAATTTPAKPEAAKPTDPTTPATPASGFGFGFGSSTPSFGFGAQPSTPSTPSTFGASQPSATTAAPGGTSTGGLSFGLSLGGPAAQPNKPATNPFGGSTTTTAAPTTPSTGNIFGSSTSGSFLTQPSFGSSFGSTPSTPAAQPTAPTTSFGTPAPSSGTSPFASFGQQSSLGSVFGQSSSLGGPTASFGSTSTFGSPATPGFGLGNPQAVQQQIQATTSASRVFGSGSTFGSPSTGGSPFSQLASSSPGFGGGQPTTGFGGFGGAPQPAAQPPQFGNSAMWAPRK